MNTHNAQASITEYIVGIIFNKPLLLNQLRIRETTGFCCENCILVSQSILPDHETCYEYKRRLHLNLKKNTSQLLKKL